jgi:hypothetical protein
MPYVHVLSASLPVKYTRLLCRNTARKEQAAGKRNYVFHQKVI